MAEYIEREAALNQFEYSSSAIPEKWARIRIEDLPAADVVPVRHAMWIFSGGDYPYCSGRGCESLSRVKRPYCQFCGALMDGKDGKKS